MSDSHGYVLQQVFKKSHEVANGGSALNKKSIAELNFQFLCISDNELTDTDLPTFIKFLSSQEARNYLRMIVIKRSSLHESSNGKISSLKKRMEAEAKSKDNKESMHSALRLEGSKLFQAICDFISKSSSLQCLIFERLTLLEEHWKKLGDSLFKCKTSIQKLSFENIEELGEIGLRLLTPYLAKMKVRLLQFEGCNINNKCMEYVASIVKSQEAVMDSHFWNYSLRMNNSNNSDIGNSNNNTSIGSRNKWNNINHVNNSLDTTTTTTSTTTTTNADVDTQEMRMKLAMRARIPGLKAISLKNNHISDPGIFTIAKHLRYNQWIIGLNLSSNCIETKGIKHLASALSTNTTLHTTVINDNPGYKAEIGQVLDYTADVAKSRNPPHFNRSSRNSSNKTNGVKNLNGGNSQDSGDHRLGLKKKKSVISSGNNQPVIETIIKYATFEENLSLVDVLASFEWRNGDIESDLSQPPSIPIMMMPPPSSLPITITSTTSGLKKKKKKIIKKRSISNSDVDAATNTVTHDNNKFEGKRHTSSTPTRMSSNRNINNSNNTDTHDNNINIEVAGKDEDVEIDQRRPRKGKGPGIILESEEDCINNIMLLRISEKNEED